MNTFINAGANPENNAAKTQMSDRARRLTELRLKNLQSQGINLKGQLALTRKLNAQAPVVNDTAANSMMGASAVAKQTGQTDYSNVFKNTGFTEGQNQLNNIIGKRDENVQKYMDFAGGENRNLQANTFTRLFGPDSRLEQFYSPNLKAIQSQISGLTGDLTNLDSNIKERMGGAVLTDAQRAKVAAQERGGLTRQLDDLTRAQNVITQALEFDKSISEAEFNAVINDANNYLGALQTQFQEMGMPEQQVSFLTNAIAQQFNREATLLSEQMNIASEKRSLAAADSQIDKEMSANQGYMMNSKGEYMLDANMNPIPFNQAGGELEWKTAGKAAFIFNPATGEYQQVAGTGGDGSGSTGPGTLPPSGPISPEFANMQLNELAERAFGLGIMQENGYEDMSEFETALKDNKALKAEMTDFLRRKLSVDRAMLSEIEKAEQYGRSIRSKYENKPAAFNAAMKKKFPNLSVGEIQDIYKGKTNVDEQEAEMKKLEKKAQAEAARAEQRTTNPVAPFNLPGITPNSSVFGRFNSLIK